MASDEVFEYGYRHGRQLKYFLANVTAHGRDNISRILGVAFSEIVSGEIHATHFRIDGNLQLTLFAHPAWSNLELAAQRFPEPLSCQQATEFVWDWLQRVEYPEDEHDGATIKGWRVFNDKFGIVGGCWEAFIAIRPVWIYIPK